MFHASLVQLHPQALYFIERELAFRIIDNLIHCLLIHKPRHLFFETKKAEITSDYSQFPTYNTGNVLGPIMSVSVDIDLVAAKHIVYKELSNVNCSQFRHPNKKFQHKNKNFPE
jgi:hypothetical protein